MGFGVRGDAEYLGTAGEAKIRRKLKNERKGSNYDLRREKWAGSEKAWIPALQLPTA